MILRDVEQRFLDRGLDTIAKNLDREVKKDKITEAEKSATLARISPATDIRRLAAADFAVEAVPEQLDLKVGVLQEADAVLRPGVILASNTSSISVTQLAAQTRPARKFHRDALHESGAGDGAGGSDSRISNRRGNIRNDHVAVRKARQKAGGRKRLARICSNRVLMPMINEAAFAVMEGVATPEAVDAVMKTGMNHPMGPLELADFIGLDVCVDILDVLLRDSAIRNIAPVRCCEKMVAAGWLGRKSGRGFYKY